MSRIYTVTFEGQTVATASGDVDLFEFSAADDKPIELVGLELAVTSELGDAAEEILRLAVIRGHTTSGNGTSFTPTPIDPSDAVAGFTAEVLGATIASAGTGVNVATMGLNVRSPASWWWPEGCGPRATQASLLVVRLMAAVADDVTMSGCAYVREV